MRRLVMASALALATAPAPAVPVGSAFTFQGRLADAGSPANGPFDLRFILYDDAAGGAQVGPIVTQDDAPVTDGLFTVTLDFGPNAFRGDARWLEVAARPGASTGGYTVIGGRQELRPSPNAVFSRSTGEVGWSGVVGKPAGFADDVDNDSGGTVTAVATGAGLTGGPITGTGTVSVATGGITTALLGNGAVTRPKIASGAVGVGQVDTAEVQTRITGVCPLGSYLWGINPDGSVVCTGLPNVHAITTAVTPYNYDAGTHVSIAIAPDGMPVISYHGELNGGNLLLTKCANAACSAGNITHTLDDAGANDVGQYSSIAIGADGLPIISYHDVTLGTLKVAKCINPTCLGGTIVTTVDDHPVNMVGAYSSIAIGTDGFPIISYYDTTAGGLKVAKCVNVNCTGLNTITTVDNPPGDVGRHTSIAIGTDGFPVISYHDSSVGGLRVAKCSTASCSSGVSITPGVTPAGGGVSDMVVPADGRPIISYEETESQNSHLKVVKCGNAACSAGNAIQELFFAPGFGGANSSLAVGTDGLPILSHHAPGSLRIAKCGTASCSSGNVLSVLDSPAGASVGQYNAIALGADGLPIVAYSDLTNGSLKVAKCGNVACN